MTHTVQELRPLLTPKQADLIGCNGVGQLLGGWIPATHVLSTSPYDVTALTATYASANSFTTSLDVSGFIKKGWRVKWTQTTVKYGVIRSISGTTVTILTNSDYTVANAAISDLHFSGDDGPYGYPGIFARALDFLTGFSASPSSPKAYYTASTDAMISESIYMNNAGTSNATGFTTTAATTCLADSGTMVWGTSCFFGTDNGNATAACSVHIVDATSTLVFAKDSNAAGWTAANGKAASFGNLTYPF